MTDAALLKLIRKAPYLLDNIELTFHWGDYHIVVHKFHLAAYSSARTAEPRRHSGFQVHYVLAGTGTVQQNNRNYRLQQGSAYVLNPASMHLQTADGLEPLEEFVLNITISKLDKRARPYIQKAIDYDVLDAEEWHYWMKWFELVDSPPVVDRYNARSCFIAAFREFQQKDVLLFTSLKMLVIRIMLLTVRNYGNLNQQAPMSLPSRNMKLYYLTMATNHMYANYKLPLTIDEVAAEVRLSGRQLQRIFRELTNRTFTGFLETYRLDRVCYALANGTQTVEAIAAAHGFAKSTYMHYVFKKRFGKTPIQYRKESQNSVRSNERKEEEE